MALFISYSSQDKAALGGLTAALHRSQHQIWIDQELGGGESWWSMICEQIRTCDIFVIALSNHWLYSKPCQAELRYAQALNRPILPVRILPADNVRINSLAALQIIDYETPTVEAGIQLVTALHALQADPRPLPDPLPEQPSLPYGYLMRLGDAMADKEISPQLQLQMVAELKSGLDEDGDDPSARSDIAQLLRMLRLRHDVTFRTRTEIDNMLGSLEPVSVTPSPLAPHRNQISSRHKRRPDAGDADSPRVRATSGRKRWAIIAAVAILLVGVSAASVLLTQNRESARPSPANPAETTTGAATPGMSGGNATELEALLLSTGEISSVLNDPNLEADHGQAQNPRPMTATLSTPDCASAFEPLEDVAYRNANGLTGVRGEPVQTAGDDPPHRIFQAVAQFASPDQATAFVQSSAAQWQTCAGTTVTMSEGQSTQGWIFSALGGGVPRIWMTRQQVNGGGVCHHVLLAVTDIVIDVMTCSHDEPLNTAGALADLISTKIPQ